MFKNRNGDGVVTFLDACCPEKNEKKGLGSWKLEIVLKYLSGYIEKEALSRSKRTFLRRGRVAFSQEGIRNGKMTRGKTFEHSDNDETFSFFFPNRSQCRRSFKRSGGMTK